MREDSGKWATDSLQMKDKSKSEKYRKHVELAWKWSWDKVELSQREGTEKEYFCKVEKSNFSLQEC